MKKILGSAVALALSALLMTGCGDEFQTSCTSVSLTD